MANGPHRELSSEGGETARLASSWPLGHLAVNLAQRCVLPDNCGEAGRAKFHTTEDKTGAEKMEMELRPAGANLKPI